MAEYHEHTLTDVVVERFQGADTQRFKTILAAVIRHLHALIREVELTPEEWFAAIEFLTATGKISDDKRQEFILLSDTLGVSMMVEMLNNRRHHGETESTVLGPFHTATAPSLPNGAPITDTDNDEKAVIVGTVKDAMGSPLAGATLDVWQAGTDGFYDVQKTSGIDLRGIFTTDDEGRFNFITVKPKYYPVPTDGPVGQLLNAANRHPYRPAHIHFLITANGYKPLVTHLFLKGDPYLDSDAVFAVRDSLVVDFVLQPDGCWQAYYDFILEKTV